MMTLEQILEDIKSPRVKKCILDSDMYNEVDDQYAISYLLKSPDRVNVRAIYAAPFSNPKSDYNPEKGMELSYREIKTLLSLIKRIVPLYYGSNSFLSSTASIRPRETLLAEPLCLISIFSLLSPWAIVSLPPSFKRVERHFISPISPSFPTAASMQSTWLNGCVCFKKERR